MMPAAFLLFSFLSDYFERCPYSFIFFFLPAFCLFLDVIKEHDYTEFCRATANAFTHIVVRKNVSNIRRHIERDTVRKKRKKKKKREQ